MLPKMIPPSPSPFNLDLSKKAPSATPAFGAGDGAKKLEKAGSGSADKGIDSVINGLFQTVFGQGANGIGQGQVGMLGDFDSEAFVESTLKQHQGGDSGGIGKVIGGLLKMIGGGS
jgi:hypothetical protein